MYIHPRRGRAPLPQVRSLLVGVAVPCLFAPCEERAFAFHSPLVVFFPNRPYINAQYYAYNSGYCFKHFLPPNKLSIYALTTWAGFSALVAKFSLKLALIPRRSQKILFFVEADIAYYNSTRRNAKESPPMQKQVANSLLFRGLAWKLCVALD